MGMTTDMVTALSRKRLWKEQHLGTKVLDERMAVFGVIEDVWQQLLKSLFFAPENMLNSFVLALETIPAL